jgi:hypothetical protein
VRNEERQTQNRKEGKQNETKQKGRKPKGREHRKANDFLALPARLMIFVKVASARRARRLISHFPNDFQVLNNERVPGNCFVPSSGLVFPLWPSLFLLCCLRCGLELFCRFWFCVTFDVFRLFVLVPSFVTFMTLSFVLSIVGVCCQFFCPLRSFCVLARCIFLAHRSSPFCSLSLLSWFI